MHTISLLAAWARSIAPALPLALGVFIGQLITWFFKPVLVLSVFLVVGAVLTLKIKVGRRLVGASTLGSILGVFTAELSELGHPNEWRASDAQVLVRVEETPQRRKPGEVVFIGREVLGLDGRVVRCRAVDLPWRNASRLHRGDLVWARGAILPILKPLNPFSWEGYLWRKGVSGEMKALFVSKPVSHKSAWVDDIRDHIRSVVVSVTDDTRGGALFLSMALGERDVLSSYVEDAFRSVGLSHLLVVSGYQVSLVFGTVFALCMTIKRMCGAGVILRNVATILALFAGGSYVVLVGAEMSSVRALVAATCMCVALVVDRPHRFAQRWATALLVMQALYPWALLDVGVVLTFAALGGIGVGGSLGRGRGIMTYLWITVCVWVLTSTVTLVWNGSFSVVGMVLNLLLAAPWSIWNCAIGGAALSLAVLSPSYGAYPLQVVAFVNELVARLVIWISGLGGSYNSLEGWSQWIAAMVMIGIGLMIMKRAIKSHSRTVRLRMIKTA